MASFEQRLYDKIEGLAKAGYSKSSAAEALGIAGETLGRLLRRADPVGTIRWPGESEESDKPAQSHATQVQAAVRRRKPAVRPGRTDERLFSEIDGLARSGCSKQEAAETLGVCCATLARWLVRLDPDRTIPWPPQGQSRKARRHTERIARGEVAVGRRRKTRPDGRALSPDEQQQLERVMRLARAGYSKREAAETLGVHRATLDRWLFWMDPDRTLPWPPRGQSRKARRHTERIRLRVVAVGGRPKHLR